LIDSAVLMLTGLLNDLVVTGLSVGSGAVWTVGWHDHLHRSVPSWILQQCGSVRPFCVPQPFAILDAADIVVLCETRGLRCMFCAGMSSCSPCPAGLFSDTAAASGCIPCPAGRYGVAGASSPNCTGPCTPSPGSYCPSGATASTPVPCPVGTLSPNGSVGACIPCPAGSRCNATALTGACDVGMYSTAGALACSPCPAGRYGNTTGMASSGCTDACVGAPGWYCGVGASSRSGVPCPGGTYTNTTGASACAICPGGRYSYSTSCLPCNTSQGARGMYCPAGSSNSSGIFCPAGQYSTSGGGATCTLWYVLFVHLCGCSFADVGPVVCLFCCRNPLVTA
jgi:hypothetical protein